MPFQSWNSVVEVSVCGGIFKGTPLLQPSLEASLGRKQWGDCLLLAAERDLIAAALFPGSRKQWGREGEGDGPLLGGGGLDPEIPPVVIPVLSREIQ